MLGGSSLMGVTSPDDDAEDAAMLLEMRNAPECINDGNSEI